MRKHFYITLGFLLMLFVTWELGSQSRQTIYDARLSIGTNNPQATLHIVPSIAGQNYLRVDDTNGTARFHVGVKTAGLPALWLPFGYTPNLTNYSIAAGADTLLLNAPANTAVNAIYFSLGESSKWSIGQNGLAPVSGNIADLGSVSQPVSTVYATNFTGQLFTGTGTEPGLLILRNTNLLGAVGFTHTGSQNASNIFDFRGVTNPVAGQFLKIHEVSGNVVTLTNDTGVSGILNFFRYVAETNVVSLTVTNIPGGYNRLRCAVFGRGTNVANAETMSFQVNGLTGVYHREVGVFTGSSVSAAYQATATFGQFSATNTVAASMGQFAQVEFPEYANTTFGKVSMGGVGAILGASTSPTYAVQSHWINTTDPITSFTFTIAGAWVTNTVFTIDLLK